MTTRILIVEKFADVYARALTKHFTGIEIHKAASAAEIAVDLAAIDVLFAFGIAINHRMIADARTLKWIASLATGVDHFLRCPGLRPETILTSARGIHGPAMRETAASLMLALSRDAARLVHNKDARRWDRGERWPLLAGKTAVIVGIGVSGSAIGELLKAFGMRVVGLSRTPREVAGFDAILPTARLAEVAADADWLINVLPGSEANQGIFSRAVFAAMKPSAYFINVGRGRLVVEEDLLAALDSGQLSGAALDVFRTEPLPADSRLWTHPNVVVTPRASGGAPQGSLSHIAENYRRLLAGQPLINIADPARGY